MTVARSAAVTAQHAGHTYYFCSDHCRDSFEANPEQYMGKSPAQDEALVHSHAH